MNTPASTLTPLVILFVSAASYFICNWQLFAYFDVLSSRSAPPFLRSGLTFLVNFSLFLAVTYEGLSLFLNWLLFALFLLLEVRLIYRLPWKFCLLCSLEGALLGLSFNLIFRSLTALVVNLPLTYFDSKLHANTAMENLKRYPIVIGFLATALMAFVIRRYFIRHHQPLLPAQTINAYSSSNLNFLLLLVTSLFAYLVLNLTIYALPVNEAIIKLWGLKAGLCTLVGLLMGLQYVFSLDRLHHFELQSAEMRRSLSAHAIQARDLTDLAYTDSLTGCLNRTRGLELLEEAIAKGAPLCLGFADVDQLKTINDTCGHAVGDRYITAIACALEQTLGEGDFICRYGGDEFLLLYTTCNAAQAELRLADALETLARLSGTSEFPLPLSISTGLVDRHPDVDGQTLLAQADQQMYDRKKSARTT